MRIDLFLKASRLCLRRAQAQELCDAGAVQINGTPAKSSRAVREGDHVTIRRRQRATTVRVLKIPTTKQVARDLASTLYEVLSDRRLDEDWN